MEPPALVKNGDVGDWRLNDVDFLASFHLPGVSDKHDRLKYQHPLPRDRRIVFHEEKHEYWIDGVKAPRSVTGLVHTYGWEFDPHAAVVAMKNGTRWPEKRASFMTDSGTEMSDGEIVEMWKSSGQIASARGTLLHWHAEMHLNGRTLEPPHSPDFAMFLTILDVLQGWGLRPFRTEISLFHSGLCLAGQADALFVDTDGALSILDWKRTKSIRFDNSFRSLKEPLQHLSDSNGWLYCLQLNVYKWMIETELGFRVAAMYLGQVHPCLPRARLITVPCMREELELIVEDQIHRGDALSGALPDATFALPQSKMCAPNALARVLMFAFHICVMAAVVCLSPAPPILCVFRAPTAQDANIFERCSHFSLSVRRMENPDRLPLGRRDVHVSSHPALSKRLLRHARAVEQWRAHPQSVNGVPNQAQGCRSGRTTRKV
jgi:hypothetical protein